MVVIAFFLPWVIVNIDTTSPQAWELKPLVKGREALFPLARQSGLQMALGKIYYPNLTVRAMIHDGINNAARGPIAARQLEEMMRHQLAAPWLFLSLGITIVSAFLLLSRPSKTVCFATTVLTTVHFLFLVIQFYIIGCPLETEAYENTRNHQFAGTARAIDEMVLFDNGIGLNLTFISLILVIAIQISTILLLKSFRGPRR